MAGRKISEQRAQSPVAGRDAIWQAVRAAQAQPFTVSSIAGATGENKRTVSSYFHNLIAAGCMERRGAAPYLYCLLKDFGVHAPQFNRKGAPVLTGMGQKNMWQSMRLTPRFTANDIAELSSNDLIDVSLRTVKDYIKHLLAAGYLRVVQKANGAKSQQAVYRLIRNTGPKAPMIQKIKRVFDQNLNKVMESVDE